MKILKMCPPYQDKKRLINTKFEIFSFKEILKDETKFAKKIKKNDYLEEGIYPIVDQGQNYIGGYTNDDNGLYKNNSFLIFGDHTRCLKYIDFSCFIGADGVKIINVKDNFKDKLNMRYLYYYLLNSNIPNDGYSRHFKYIKELLYVIPPMEIQEKIVKILDEAQNLIDKRKEQIELLNKLIESIFYDMFGDPIKNEKGWEIDKLGNHVIINPTKSEVSKKKEENIDVSFIPMQNVLEDGTLILKETKKISDVYKGYTYLKENDVLFAKITPCMENGKGCIAKNLVNGIGFASTEFHVIRMKETLIKEYVYALTKNKLFRKRAENKMTGSAGQKRVPKSFIESYNIYIPPLSLQNEFAEKVEAIEEQKKRLEKSLELMEDNYNSLMQDFFR